MARRDRVIRVLGIETSCDETAASVVELRNGRPAILSNVVLSQIEEHAAFGGVVPEIAARAHVEALDGVIAAALADSATPLSGIDAVAVTAGPGLVGGLIVGLMTAKAIAAATGKRLIPVNHLEGHALTARLTDRLDFPYLLLLLSGGHTQIVLVRGVGDYRRWATTIDDALGEAFDKTAKMLGLPYPGGPSVERAARSGDPRRFAFPRPMKGSAQPDFSFSGLKTAVRQAAMAEVPLSEKDVADICASFQRAVSEAVADRVGKSLARFLKEHRGPSSMELPPPLAPPRKREGDGAVVGSESGRSGAGGKAPNSPPPCGEGQGWGSEARPIASKSAAIALKEHPGIAAPALVVAGGVAANAEIRASLDAQCREFGFRFVAPPPELCTDNAAMIAWAGIERIEAGMHETDPFAFAPRSRWPLDEVSAPVVGSGRRGAKA